MKRKEPAPSQTAGESLTFEQMMVRLEELVSELEEGQLSLEDSIRSFEEGIRLVKKCTAVLGEAEKRIHRLTQEGVETVETEPTGGKAEERGGRDDELPF